MCHVGFDGIADGPGPGVHVRDSVAPGLGMGDRDADCVTRANVAREHDSSEDGEVLESVVHICHAMC